MRSRSRTPRAEEKLCPYCAETIKAAAIKCRYCGSDLTNAPDEASEPEEPVEPEPEPEPVAESEEPGEPGEPEETPRGLAPERRLTLALVILIVVVGGVLAAVVHRASGDTEAPDGQLTSEGSRAAIMSEAVQLTEKAMTYRAGSASKDIEAAEKLMTPRMRTEYEKSLPASKDRSSQAKLGVRVTGRVATLTGGASPQAGAAQGGTTSSATAQSECKETDCAVSLLSATSDKARVLLFVDQRATASGTKNAVLSPTWQVVTLVKQNGTWLIDDMSAA